MDNEYGILENICGIFRICGKMTGFTPLTDGNINKTFKVDFDTGKSYILQRINTFVFTHPEQVMSNIDMVSTHLMSKCKSSDRIHFHHTDSNLNYFTDTDGSFWRIRNYIEAVTFNSSSDIKVLTGAGKAFGRFQTDLADFDASALYHTIPDFHNTAKRYVKFIDDVNADVCGRVPEVKKEIEFLKEVREEASQLSHAAENGEVATRVTHNDTKMNNVLFDANTLEPLAVIDLDTVMPGLAMYDFGDAVRSAASTSCEDETDLSKVSVDIGKFRAFTEGFIGQTVKGLTAKEIDLMALGAFTITTELGMRFLDDYITGDKYFKINYPTHNLVRAVCQLRLAQDMLSKKDIMIEIVKECAEKSI